MAEFDLDNFAELSTRKLTKTIRGTSSALVTFTYNSADFTADKLDSIASVRRAGSRALGEAIDTILVLLVDWDLKRGGTVVPLIDEELRRVPLPILNGILDDIYADQNPGNG